ncbi:hypothetical protein [Orrella dioscoreae]|uniref:hypothetical protein n=1 Tax=Orrella dioscoreae TaxID=1851544 RepID=UPI001300006D|nr:hypothetical protein [Orrella dioscoreae]
MSDTQLIALSKLLDYLLVQHFEQGSELFVIAADGEHDLAHDMREAVCLAHVATRRAMRERDMPEAA